MEAITKVAIDVMGGDYAPVEPIKGAIAAIQSNKKIKVYLVGKKEIVEEELSKYEYDEKQVEIVDAREVIETAEPPVLAIRKKKD